MKQKLGFTVIEENNGTMYLSIYDEKENFIYVHAYPVYPADWKEELAWDIDALMRGENPEEWDANEIVEVFDEDEDEYEHEKTAYYLLYGDCLEEDGYVKDVGTRVIMQKEAGADKKVKTYTDAAGIAGRDVIRRFEAGETAAIA